MIATIMFPDYQGKASFSDDPNGFVTRVRKTMPDARLVPILNGSPQSDLENMANGAVQRGLEPVISTDPRGLLGALVTGYLHVAATKIMDGPVVRLDTAEHPPEMIGTLIAVLPYDGMVIGDLDFADGHLVGGSVDEFAHLNLFPELYRQFTNGRLALSCAYGFQVFSGARVVSRILPWALNIAEHAQQQEKRIVTWGFDGAMALGALKILPQASGPTVVKVPSETTRNRPCNKILDQFAGALKMCRAYTKLYR